MKILGIIIALLLLFTLVACGQGTPSRPTVVTNQCTNLTTTSLTAQGTITGGTNITRRGFYYDTGLFYGLEFDGTDDYVQFPAGSQPTGAFTLAIWCKPASWNHTDYPGLFGGKGLRSYADGLSGITIARYADRLYFDVADETNATRRTMTPLLNDIAPVGQWSFIVLTNSGVATAGGLKLYRNNAVPVGNTTGAATVRWMENYTRLGYSTITGGYFKGIVGEVRIYNRALNATEIQALYSGQDVTSSLRGYWKLNEGSGNRTNDSSGNGNNGMLLNGPVWFTGGHIVYETGSFGTGAYSLPITGLLPDTWYRIMAFAENGLGTGYGNVVTCKTPA
jgi:hypothetical protein